MNPSGKMIAVNLAYKDKHQFALGQPRSKRLLSAYQGSKKDKAFMNAHQPKNTYVNYPNKSQEILQKKKAVNSKILEQSNDPRIAQPISGLKGTLHVQMQNYRPFNSKSSINQFNRSRAKRTGEQGAE